MEYKNVQFQKPPRSIKRFLNLNTSTNKSVQHNQQQIPFIECVQEFDSIWREMLLNGESPFAAILDVYPQTAPIFSSSFLKAVVEYFPDHLDDSIQLLTYVLCGPDANAFRLSCTNLLDILITFLPNSFPTIALFLEKDRLKSIKQFIQNNGFFYLAFYASNSENIVHILSIFNSITSCLAREPYLFIEKGFFTKPSPESPDFTFGDLLNIIFQNSDDDHKSELLSTIADLVCLKDGCKEAFIPYMVTEFPNMVQNPLFRGNSISIISSLISAMPDDMSDLIIKWINLLLADNDILTQNGVCLLIESYTRRYGFNQNFFQIIHDLAEDSCYRVKEFIIFALESFSEIDPSLIVKGEFQSLIVDFLDATDFSSSNVPVYPAVQLLINLKNAGILIDEAGSVLEEMYETLPQFSNLQVMVQELLNENPPTEEVAELPPDEPFIPPPPVVLQPQFSGEPEIEPFGIDIDFEIDINDILGVDE